MSTKGQSDPLQMFIKCTKQNSFYVLQQRLIQTKEQLTNNFKRLILDNKGHMNK
jgi:hypothetical protein